MKKVTANLQQMSVIFLKYNLSHIEYFLSVTCKYMWRKKKGNDSNFEKILIVLEMIADSKEKKGETK